MPPEGRPSRHEFIDAAFKAAGIDDLKEGDVITPSQWRQVMKLMGEELNIIPTTHTDTPPDTTTTEE